MYMLMMVLDDSTKLGEVLMAWEEAGIFGVTILESTGINRILTRTQAHPAMMRFGGMFGSQRVGHNTLFTVIDSLALAEEAVSATEKVLGDLSQPDTGLIFVLPVVQAWGLSKEYTTPISIEQDKQ